MKREFEFLNDVNMDFSEYEEVPFTEQERLTMKKNLKQSNKTYRSHKRMMWAAGLAACLAVTSQTAFAKDLAEKIFSLGHSSIITETESDSAEVSSVPVPDELKGQIFDADGKEMTELSSADPGYYDKDGNPVNINSVVDNDGNIHYSISKYSADDPLGDVDGVITLDSIDDLDLSFDLKVPETLPDGFSLTKVYSFSDEDGNASPDYAVLAYSDGKDSFTIHERLDSEDTQFVTSLPDPQEMDFHGSTAVYNDSEFYAAWDGTNISIIGNDVLTGDALLEVAESMK